MASYALYDSYTFHIDPAPWASSRSPASCTRTCASRGTALSRSINAQAEHWMRIGMLAELHPDLDHRELCQLLVRAEMAGGLDLAMACAPSEPHAARPSGRATGRAAKGRAMNMAVP